MNGIGRKIRLWPEYDPNDSTLIIRYIREMCYIFEGQFVDDEMCELGRLVMREGTAY